MTLAVSGPAIVGEMLDVVSPRRCWRTHRRASSGRQEAGDKYLSFGETLRFKTSWMRLLRGRSK